MSLNNVPSSERVHISFFGRRNVGKSSLINAVTGQNLSIVSDVKGTTTDPVLKTMELLPIGPVVIIDTAGIDDEGKIGELRVEKTLDILRKTDIAILVVDSNDGIKEEDRKLLKNIEDRKIPYIICYNKSDLKEVVNLKENEISVSAKNNINIYELKELIGKIVKGGNKKRLIGDSINKGDIIILVVPIDKSAPKGRLILPQQQAIRDILDSNGICITVQDTELEETLKLINRKPKLVITDSQVFKKVAKIVPEDIEMTSFSILMLQYKGELQVALEGVKKLESLKDGDNVLISEACTHHRQCEDIGTVKLPNWIREYTKKDLNFSFTSGGEFPKDLSKYELIIHCGGCMINEKEMKYRINEAIRQGVPITNYGIVISYVNGILERIIK